MTLSAYKDQYGQTYYADAPMSRAPLINPQATTTHAMPITDGGNTGVDPFKDKLVQYMHPDSLEDRQVYDAGAEARDLEQQQALQPSEYNYGNAQNRYEGNYWDLFKEIGKGATEISPDIALGKMGKAAINDFWGSTDSPRVEPIHDTGNILQSPNYANGEGESNDNDYNTHVDDYVNEGNYGDPNASAQDNASQAMQDYQGDGQGMADGGLVTDHSDLLESARNVVQGAGVGAGINSVGGVPAMLNGAKNGAISALAVEVAKRLFPKNPDAASLLAQGLTMGPLGIPAIVGGAAELTGIGKGDNSLLRMSKDNETPNDGSGSGMMTGGPVIRQPQEAPRPPNPGRADDLQRNLSEGEFVIPADVVKHYGLNHFDQLITKARSPKKGLLTQTN